MKLTKLTHRIDLICNKQVPFLRSFYNGRLGSFVHEMDPAEIDRASILSTHMALQVMLEDPDKWLSTAVESTGEGDVIKLSHIRKTLSDPSTVHTKDGEPDMWIGPIRTPFLILSLLYLKASPSSTKLQQGIRFPSDSFTATIVSGS